VVTVRGSRTMAETAAQAVGALLAIAGLLGALDER
jgi:hypothetical protein